MFPDHKAVKICNDAKNIAALPVPLQTKCQLIASKVIPQCTFAADISSIPKLTCAKIENEIANTIWGRRPHWRARMLVFAFLCNPCFVHPRVARAYVTVRNLWRAIHRKPPLLERLRDLFHDSATRKHSLLAHFRDALTVFRCTLLPNMNISLGASQLSILDISPKDLKGLLHTLGRQYCYEHVNYNSRKDVKKPSGLLDFGLSTAFKGGTNSSGPHKTLVAHFDAQIVGCTITNDRRAAAGFIDSAACRYCQNTKESLLHIVRDCPAAPDFIACLQNHELGPNFCGLGIVEHPSSAINHRVQLSALPTYDCTLFDPTAPGVVWFSDGSVLLQESYWLTSAAFAIYDQNESLIRSGPVKHVALASYTAELFALAVAVIIAPARLHLVADCQTIVDLFTKMCACHTIPGHWSHRPIWMEIQRVWKLKLQQCEQPVHLEWMPAHTCDHQPLAAIAPEATFANGCPGWKVRANRLADEEAKRIASQQAIINVNLWPIVFAAAHRRQAALVSLNQIIGSEGIVKKVFQTIEENQQTDVSDDHKSRFPSWNWHPNEADFAWLPTAHCSAFALLNDICPNEDSGTFGRFLLSLRWKLDPGLSIAYVEIAHIFLSRHFSLTSFEATDTFGSLVRGIKKWCSDIFAIEDQCLLPGIHKRDGHHSCGWALPRGVIVGARPYITETELRHFADLLFAGAGSSLLSWSFSIADHGA